MFGQTFTYNDLIVVAFLVILEGVLSIDNALVLRSRCMTSNDTASQSEKL